MASSKITDWSSYGLESDGTVRKGSALEGAMHFLGFPLNGPLYSADDAAKLRSGAQIDPSKWDISKFVKQVDDVPWKEFGYDDDKNIGENSVLSRVLAKNNIPPDLFKAAMEAAQKEKQKDKELEDLRRENERLKRVRAAAVEEPSSVTDGVRLGSGGSFTITDSDALRLIGHVEGNMESNIFNFLHDDIYLGIAKRACLTYNSQLAQNTNPKHLKLWTEVRGKEEEDILGLFIGVDIDYVKAQAHWLQHHIRQADIEETRNMVITKETLDTLMEEYENEVELLSTFMAGRSNVVVSDEMNKLLSFSDSMVKKTATHMCNTAKHDGTCAETRFHRLECFFRLRALKALINADSWTRALRHCQPMQRPALLSSIKEMIEVPHIREEFQTYLHDSAIDILSIRRPVDIGRFLVNNADLLLKIFSLTITVPVWKKLFSKLCGGKQRMPVKWFLCLVVVWGVLTFSDIGWSETKIDNLRFRMNDCECKMLAKTLAALLLKIPNSDVGLQVKGSSRAETARIHSGLLFAAYGYFDSDTGHMPSDQNQRYKRGPEFAVELPWFAPQCYDTGSQARWIASVLNRIEERFMNSGMAGRLQNANKYPMQTRVVLCPNNGHADGTTGSDEIDWVKCVIIAKREVDPLEDRLLQNTTMALIRCLSSDITTFVKEWTVCPMIIYIFPYGNHDEDGSPLKRRNIHWSEFYNPEWYTPENPLHTLNDPVCACVKCRPNLKVNNCFSGMRPDKRVSSVNSMLIWKHQTRPLNKCLSKRVTLAVFWFAVLIKAAARKFLRSRGMRVVPMDATMSRDFLAEQFLSEFSRLPKFNEASDRKLVQQMERKLPQAMQNETYRKGLDAVVRALREQLTPDLPFTIFLSCEDFNMKFISVRAHSARMASRCSEAFKVWTSTWREVERIVAETQTVPISAYMVETSELVLPQFDFDTLNRDQLNGRTTASAVKCSSAQLSVEVNINPIIRLALATSDSSYIQRHIAQKDYKAVADAHARQALDGTISYCQTLGEDVKTSLSKSPNTKYIAWCESTLWYIVSQKTRDEFTKRRNAIRKELEKAARKERDKERRDQQLALTQKHECDELIRVTVDAAVRRAVTAAHKEGVAEEAKEKARREASFKAMLKLNADRANARDQAVRAREKQPVAAARPAPAAAARPTRERMQKNYREQPVQRPPPPPEPAAGPSTSKSSKKKNRRRKNKEVTDPNEWDEGGNPDVFAHLRRLNRAHAEAETRQMEQDEALARKLQEGTENVAAPSLEPETRAKPEEETMAVESVVEAVFARHKAEKQPNVDTDNTCVVCLDMTPTHIVVPCGHHCLCAGCASMKLDSCPMCKGSIGQIIKVFTVGN